MKERLKRLQTRIDQLSLRERAFLFLGIAAILYTLFDNLLISPQERHQRQLFAEIAKVRADIKLLEQQKLDILNRHSQDPDSEEQRVLQQLKEEIHQVDTQIGEVVSGLIAPLEMARALERVLAAHPGLRFARVENLGAVALLEVTPEEGDTAGAGIYRHSMRIELEGSFQQGHDYLLTLEQLPWRFHWEGVDIEMLDYPVARIVITVSTLSLSEGWIGV